MVLVNLSGGIESTYCAWKALLEAKKKGEKVILHHIHLVSGEKRWKMEWEAVKKILKWFRSHRLNNYELVEHSFSYGTINRKLPGFAASRIRDFYIIAFCAGIVLRRFPRINRVIRSVSKTEVEDTRTLHDGTIEERDALYEEIMNTMGVYPGKTKPRIKRESPIIGMTKQEIMRAMPKDLLAMTWSCRRPKNNKPCGKCDACKSLKTCYNNNGGVR